MIYRVISVNAPKGACKVWMFSNEKCIETIKQAVLQDAKQPMVVKMRCDRFEFRIDFRISRV